MALFLCPECKRQISDKAESCPGCGYLITSEVRSKITQKLKRKELSKWQIILVVLAVLGVSIFIAEVSNDSQSSDSGSPTSKAVKKEVQVYYQVGDNVHVGDFYYKVSRTEWVDSLRSLGITSKPDAKFLKIWLDVQNGGFSPRDIPPIFLVDQKGRQYSTSNAGLLLEGTITAMDTLNPEVKKSGGVIFDAPKDNKYFLYVSGGQYSDKYAFIKLSLDDKATGGEK